MDRGLPPAVAAELRSRYAEPHRRYHDLRHLEAVLARVTELAAEAEDSQAVRLAAWFHDAVYQPTRHDNEQASAELATRLLTTAGLPAEHVAEVARLVRLTATHDPAPGDTNGAVLCDADLAVLAADRAAYDAYARDVRAEYAHLSDAAFRTGRAQVLRDLLARPLLFRTVAGRRWEAPARANLARELSATGVAAVPPPEDAA